MGCFLEKFMRNAAWGVRCGGWRSGAGGVSTIRWDAWDAKLGAG